MKDSPEDDRADSRTAVERHRLRVQPYVERIADGELFAGRADRMMRKLERTAWSRLYPSFLRKGGFGEVEEVLPLNLIEYLALGRLEYDEAHPEVPQDDDPDFDTDCIKIAYRWLGYGVYDAIKAINRFDAPPDDDPQGARTDDFAEDVLSGLGTGSAIDTVFRWLVRTQDSAGGDGTGERSKDVHGIGLTWIQLELLRQYALACLDAPPKIGADPSEEYLRTSRLAIKQVIGDADDHEKEQGKARKTMDRAIHRLKLTFYVLGALGRHDALVSDEGIDAAIDRYRTRYRPGVTRIAERLQRERTLLDDAVHAAVLVPSGARIDAAAFEQFVTRSVPESTRALANIREIDGSVHPTDVLHSVERNVARSMGREDPDCVLRDGCTVDIPQSDTGGA